MDNLYSWESGASAPRFNRAAIMAAQDLTGALGASIRITGALCAVVTYGLRQPVEDALEAAGFTAGSCKRALTDGKAVRLAERGGDFTSLCKAGNQAAAAALLAELKPRKATKGPLAAFIPLMSACGYDDEAKEAVRQDLDDAIIRTYVAQIVNGTSAGVLIARAETERAAIMAACKDPKTVTADPKVKRNGKGKGKGARKAPEVTAAP